MVLTFKVRGASFALVASLVGASLLGGCAVGPDYQRPDLKLPTSYTATPVAPTTAPLDVPAEWWQAFHSEPLNALVKASLEHNPDVDAAQAALRAARESAAVEQASVLPSATLGFSPTRQRVAGEVASGLNSGASLYNLNTAQVSVSYAPDVFGGTRRAVESARALAEVQRFQLEATKLTLSSNVVVAAVTEAGLRAQREATLAIIAEQREILRSYQRQLALGNVAPADVSAQEAALAGTEATLPPLDKQLAQASVLLSTLAGRYPSDEVEVQFKLSDLQLPAELPLTLPAQLVEHRPDVRAAEAQLQSASAGIGMAVAARLPNVQLGVNAYGSQASSLSHLFTSSSVFWTLAASVTQPLFDGGAGKHREAAARAAFDQAAAQYRGTVLGAFSDVANSLQASAADARAEHFAAVAEQAANVNLARTKNQVELGDASPLALRLAQQTEQQAQLTLVQARVARLSDAAALFQSLGGGWWREADVTSAR